MNQVKNSVNKQCNMDCANCTQRVGVRASRSFDTETQCVSREVPKCSRPKTNIERRRVRKHRFSPEIRGALKSLSEQKSDFAGIVAIFSDVFVIFSSIALSLFLPILYPISILLIGCRMRGLATILHESSHLTLCRSHKLNKVLGFAAAWSILQTLYAYNMSHLGEHHRHLGDPKRDPDYKNYIDQGLFKTPPKKLVSKHLIPLVLGLKSVANLKNLINDRFLPRSFKEMPKSAKLEYVAFVSFWLLVLGAVFASGLHWEFLLFWIVPYLTTFQAINWLIELCEHYPLIALFDRELHVTRNRRGNSVENLLTGIHGENWHLVHHMHPGIPFHRLEDAHEIMMTDIEYADANTGSGGIFSRGPNGEPSIISIMRAQFESAEQKNQ